MTEPLTKVQFTNLDKILYPEAKITKAQVIEYYIRIAPLMLPFLTDRPIVLTRFPDGADKEGFYEKNAPAGLPSWVKTLKSYSESAKREINYILCNDLDTLVWLANLAALEIHMTLAIKDSLDTPDLVLFDLDPEPPAGFAEAVEAAFLLKDKLDSLGLRAYAKTSGKKGLHIVVPIVQAYTFQQTREFVHMIGKYLARDSNILVSELSKSKEPGTVYIDYLQNSHGRTMICPYSLRATPRATVSTPLDWADLKKDIRPEKFNLLRVVKIRKKPWRRMLEDRQSLEMKSE